MPDTIRVTRKTARLLRVLLGVHESRAFAASIECSYHMGSREVMRLAQLHPGSFYPLVDRLEEHGWVEREKETVPASEDRPPRTFYCLTEDGARLARQAVQEDDVRTPWWKRVGGDR